MPGKVNWKDIDVICAALRVIADMSYEDKFTTTIVKLSISKVPKDKGEKRKGHSVVVRLPMAFSYEACEHLLKWSKKDRERVEKYLK